MKYKVPFVNYGLQYNNLKKEIDQAIARILEGGDLILRKDVEDFENSLANFAGSKYAVALNSGTDALVFSLLAVGIGKGDEVITVSHTFIASISAIVRVGAKPVLVDVNDDYLIDLKKAEKAITPKTKAIIPVYLNGRMPDMEKLIEISQRHNLIIIEDSAQALGANFNGKRAGSIGAAGCFSFYPAKILGSLGDGGAITTNDSGIAEKIRLLRDHGQKTKTQITCYGYNSRLDNLQAAVLNVKLKYLSEWVKRRREIAQIYNQGLREIKEIKIPPSGPSANFDVYQNYVIRAQNRDNLFNFLKEKGVETLIKDPVANHQQEGLGLSRFELPLTEQLSKEVISLPMYPELTDEQIKYVIDSVKNFYKYETSI